MKNVLSKLKPYLLEILFIVGLFSAVGFYLYVKYIEPNQIQQEVTVMLQYEQVSQYQIWETVDRVSAKEHNPFDLDETCYVLYTKLGDKYDYDYGTEDYILAKKCERYAEYEKAREEYIALRDSIESAYEKTKQAQEDALDRLNEKSCN